MNYREGPTNDKGAPRLWAPCPYDEALAELCSGWISIREAAKVLSVSPNTLRSALHKTKYPGLVRVDKRAYRVHLPELICWLREYVDNDGNRCAFDDSYWKEPDNEAAIRRAEKRFAMLHSTL